MAALSPAQMADIIGQACGKPLDIDQVLQDIEAGAPVDAEGKINLLHYAAWLAQQLKDKK